MLAIPDSEYALYSEHVPAGHIPPLNKVGPQPHLRLHRTRALAGFSPRQSFFLALSFVANDHRCSTSCRFGCHLLSLVRVLAVERRSGWLVFAGY